TAFFFQAEDGIRDRNVTGVQTCALPILNLKPTDPNYDIKQLAIECSIKRMYPDIISYDKIVELTGSFKAPMGCRSFLQGWKNDRSEERRVGKSVDLGGGRRGRGKNMR